MFEIKMGNILAPMVKTSTGGGLSNEDLAELCLDKMLSISETAHPHIQEQAKVFRNRVRVLLFHYLEEARKSERANCINHCSKGGYKEAAELLRRI